MPWSEDWRWQGDPKPIANEIRAQLARHGQQQRFVMETLGLKSRAPLWRRMSGIQKWERWELEWLAAAWDIQLSDLTGENSNDHTRVPADP